MCKSQRVLVRAPFVYYVRTSNVAQEFKRMIQNHAWSGKAHHFTDVATHGGAITMHRTSPAWPLGVAEPAVSQPRTGILNKRTALRTQFSVALTSAAINRHHQFNNPYLFFNPVHKLACCNIHRKISFFVPYSVDSPVFCQVNNTQYAGWNKST